MDLTELDFSEAFLSAFKNMGGDAFDCECGREHIDVYAIQSSYMSDDEANAEVEEYEERAKTDKNLILRYDDETFEVMHIGGQTFVYGCECEGWKKYMNFMVHYRYPIKDFLLGIQIEVEKMVEQEKVFKILKNTTLG